MGSTADWVLTVGELMEYVRRQLSRDPVLSRVRVRGEISGFKRHYSGHLYFSVKDDKARVQCVMFRQNALSLAFEPRDGMRVVVGGSASVYPASGSFQVYCESITQEGAGELFMQFEALKAKLSLEGLFDPALKRPLPFLPTCVGIVTSRSGAAFHDMVQVIRRRYPRMDILLASAQVQGEGAAESIARALDRLNDDGRARVILCGRGGGSMEDLWAFNEETVARAIARSRIPVVSCVGHEVDFTIADFVADQRAATPSVAAELAVPVWEECKNDLAELSARLRGALKRGLDIRRERLNSRALSRALVAPGYIVVQKRTELNALGARLDALMATRMAKARFVVEGLSRTIGALSPSHVLSRGYALVEGEQGRVLPSLADVGDRQHITIRMRDGRARVTVDERGLNTKGE